MVRMTRIPSKTLLWVALALAAVPAVFAQSVLGTVGDIVVQIIGPSGLGIYGSGIGTAIFDSIIALLIFVGLSMRILSNRIGKPAAIGIGLALAVGLVAWMQSQSWSFKELGPYALFLLIIGLTYMVYWVVSMFGQNKLASFAAAFFFTWIVAREWLGPTFGEQFKELFTILNMLWMICFVVLIILAFRLIGAVGGGVGRFGGGFGGGFTGNGAFGSGGGFTQGNNLIENGIGSFADWRAKRNEEKQQNAQRMADVVTKELLGKSDELKATLAQQEKDITVLRTSLQQLQDYVTQVERAAEPLRGTVRGVSSSLALDEYRKTIANSRGQLDSFFQSQRGIVQASVKSVGILSTMQQRQAQIEPLFTQYQNDIRAYADAMKPIADVQTKLIPVIKATIKDARDQYAKAVKLQNDIPPDGRGQRVDLGLAQLAKHEQKLVEHEKALVGIEELLKLAATSRDQLAKVLGAARSNAKQFRADEAFIKRHNEIVQGVEASVGTFHQQINQYLTSLSTSDYSECMRAASTTLQRCDDILKQQEILAQAEAEITNAANELARIKAAVEQYADTESAKRIGTALDQAQAISADANVLLYLASVVGSAAENYKAIVEERTTDEKTHKKTIAKARRNLRELIKQLPKNWAAITKAAATKGHRAKAAALGVSEESMDTVVQLTKQDMEAIGLNLSRFEAEIEKIAEASRSAPAAP